jgi:hypothetical protein
MSSKKCGEFLDRLDKNMLAKRDSTRFSRRYCRRHESSWNVTACQLLNSFGSFEKLYCLHLQNQAVQKDLLGCIANETDLDHKDFTAENQLGIFRAATEAPLCKAAICAKKKPMFIYTHSPTLITLCDLNNSIP